MFSIIGSIDIHNEPQKNETDKENDQEMWCKKFIEKLDLLFYVYINWWAQGLEKFRIEQNRGGLLEDVEIIEFQRVNNRIFTVPELEPYSGSLIINLEQKKLPNLNDNNEDLHSLKEIKSNENHEINKRTRGRKKGMKVNRELKPQNILYRELKTFNDSEINEVLSNFNIFVDFWKGVPFKTKFF